MLHSKNLLHLSASLITLVLAIPAESISPPAIHRPHDSREARSLASPILVYKSLINMSNLALPAISFPEYNTSSNAEPTVFCHINPPLPTPPTWSHVDIVECGLLIMAMLADVSADLHASQWSSTYPLELPWTWGVSPHCKIKINAVNPRSSDVFPQVMIAQRAALIVKRCLNNKGG